MGSRRPTHAPRLQGVLWRPLASLAVLMMMCLCILCSCGTTQASSASSARHHVCGFMKALAHASMQPGGPDGRELIELRAAAELVDDDTLREDASAWAAQLDRFARGKTNRVPTTLMMDVAEDCRALGLHFAAP